MMPAKRSKAILLAPFLLLLFGAPLETKAAWVEGPRILSSGEDASRFTLNGKITDAGQGKFTVNTEENILFHVRYNDQTEIERSDGMPGSTKDLRVGARVHVEGDLEESGEIAASKIVLQEKAAKKP